MALDPRRCSPDRAEEELVRAHLPLVDHEVAAVSRRLPTDVLRDDLAAAGRTALALAARAYEPAHGVPFAGYAARRIAGAVLDELRSVDWAGRPARRRVPEQGAAAETTGMHSDVHRSVVLSWSAIVAMTGAEPSGLTSPAERPTGSRTSTGARSL